MDNTQEKSADIIAEMRAYAKRCRNENFGVAPECEAHYTEDDVEDLADRLEAARKREDGNAAALREAVVEILQLAKVADYDNGRDWNDEITVKIIDIADRALATPPRVCDVNTLGSLSYFVEKAILTSDLLKDTHEIVKRIVVLLTSLPRGNESKGRRRPCIS